MKLINQYFGIGDIIFSMSAIRSLNDKIIWPVLPEYVEGCNRAYPDIDFIDYNLLKIDYDRKDRYQLDDMDVIPLRWQDSPLNKCMQLKYQYFGLSWQGWKQNAKWQRDFTKEEQLIKRFDIHDGEDFNLINIKFGCWSQTKLSPGTSTANFQIPNNGLRNVEMFIGSEFSLFDWAAIIQRARYIYTVSTSVLYLIEMLDLCCKEIHLYPRIPDEKDFRNVDYLFTKPYILHT